MDVIAYLGPEGTFSEEAAKAFSLVSDNRMKPMPCSTIIACAEAVEDMQANYAVVPLENSLEGSVHDTLDILTTSLNLSILAELDLDIEHNLLSLADTTENIQHVYSHPQALAQCRGYLRNHLAGVQTSPVLSTAKAAAVAVKTGLSAAAIASRRAAEQYGLKILASGIQDANSTTRFVILGQNRKQFGQAVKTSLVFSVKNAAGSLYQVLRVFAAHNVNLTRIESRPAKSRLGDYIFFVDIDGTSQDSAVKTALREASQEAVMLKLLGSYPVLSFQNV